MSNIIKNTSVNDVAFASNGKGSSIAPGNLGDIVKFAEVMAESNIALPKHLRDNSGACTAVAMQALQWEMNPFAVAAKSYSVSGVIAYEAQLIAAVVNTRSGIKGRLKYNYTGSGNTLKCTVTGILDGDECSYTTPQIGNITVKNSPLWKADPEQQLGYYAARSWARRHCPEVLLGVYDREEVENFHGSNHAKDITPASPNAQKYLGKVADETVTEIKPDGFDAETIDAEIGTLTASSTSHDDAATGGGASSLVYPPPDYSTLRQVLERLFTILDRVDYEKAEDPKQYAIDEAKGLFVKINNGILIGATKETLDGTNIIKNAFMDVLDGKRDLQDVAFNKLFNGEV